MDTQRLVLFLIFTFSLFLLFDAWQKEHHAPPTFPAAVLSSTQQAQPPTPGANLTQEQVSAPAQAGEKLGTGQKVIVRTDYLLAEIDSAGGDLRRLELLKQLAALNSKKHFVLFENRPDHVYVAQSGLIGPGLPTHKTQFTVSPGTYELKPGQNQLVVRLEAPAVNGVKVIKVYTFHRSSYVIDVGYEITNTGSAPIKPFSYFQFLRDSKPPAGEPKFVHLYTGPALYTQQSKFEKISFADIEKGKADYPKSADNGWIAMLQHYFLGAWLPQGKTPREFYGKHLGDDLYTAGVILPVGAIEPGKSGSIEVPLYAGPQEQTSLSKLAPGLDLTVDYGWLTVIAAPLFWVLSFIEKWVGNWGGAIILLTVLIKLLFFPLSTASYRSMAKMRVLAPKLQRLKEQYGDDRQRLHQAMMELYKTEKINPLGGCLPVVVQIPVFISLYWVLLASVELRHAPFILWIHDLSAPDPYYILPIVMGATMILQTRLNPTPPDPIQAKMMKIMPIAFSIFFFSFPPAWCFTT